MHVGVGIRVAVMKVLYCSPYRTSTVPSCSTKRGIFLLLLDFSMGARDSVTRHKAASGERKISTVRCP